MNGSNKQGGIILILIGLLGISLVFNLAPSEPPQLVQNTIVQCNQVGNYDQYTKHMYISTEGLDPAKVELILLHEYYHFIADRNGLPNTEQAATEYERTHIITGVVK